jgi:predicted phage gp36 major capsid-like protein
MTLFGHEFAVETIVTWLITVVGFIFMLGQYRARFDALREDHKALREKLEKEHTGLRDHLEARDMKLEAELKMMSDNSANWREAAAGRFATREEVTNSNGIAKAITAGVDRLLLELRK